MESIYTDLALYGSKNQCAKMDNVFFPISEVCGGTVSLCMSLLCKFVLFQLFFFLFFLPLFCNLYLSVSVIFISLFLYLYFCISEIHGIDMDLSYRHGLMVLRRTHGVDIRVMVQKRTHGIDNNYGTDSDSWYRLGQVYLLQLYRIHSLITCLRECHVLPICWIFVIILWFRDFLQVPLSLTHLDKPRFGQQLLYQLCELIARKVPSNLSGIASYNIQ